MCGAAREPRGAALWGLPEEGLLPSSPRIRAGDEFNCSGGGGGTLDRGRTLQREEKGVGMRQPGLGVFRNLCSSLPFPVTSPQLTCYFRGKWMRYRRRGGRRGFSFPGSFVECRGRQGLDGEGDIFAQCFSL